MRIAFTGSSGTGKSTLSEHIAQVLGVPINPVGSRSTAKELGFENPYDVDRASLSTYKACLAHDHENGFDPDVAAAANNAIGYFEDGEPTCRSIFQRKLQIDKVGWEINHPNMVSDRSTVDDFVYCALHDRTAMDEDYIKRAKRWLAEYDIIFFTPISTFHNLAGDPARLSDMVYHVLFEDLAKGLLMTWLGPAEFRRKVHTVWHTELELRKVLVEQTVETFRREL